MRFYISDLKNHVGQKVELRGWVYNARSSGKIKFLQLRDGTGICQCVFVKGESNPEAFDVKFDKLTQESTVRVTGTVRADGRKPGVFEVGAEDVEITSIAEPYPISPKEHGTDFLMNNRHLWLRSKRQHAILRVRAEIVAAVRDFFDGRGFTLTDAPIFTPSACEGTSTLFETQYFDEKAFLSQSGQLYMEATAAALGKVYCFGPTFRAEKSKTRRHLIEFWMVEPEVAFNDIYDNMELAEQFVEYVVQRTIKNRAEELYAIDASRDPVGANETKLLPRIEAMKNIMAPFPRIHYDEAARIIKKENPAFVIGDDFGGTDETIISSKHDRPVFVHHYPAAVKAFYMKEDPKEPGKSMSCDLLATEGYGEIIGGGQREDDLARLKEKIAEHKLKEADFAWFMDLRRYGTFPHAGFGLGIERTVSWICGLPHIRETIPFPRLYGRHYP